MMLAPGALEGIQGARGRGGPRAPPAPLPVQGGQQDRSEKGPLPGERGPCFLEAKWSLSGGQGLGGRGGRMALAKCWCAEVPLPERTVEGAGASQLRSLISTPAGR